MEKLTILSADLLDIIFEHRNKLYGAYELRKTYNKRITYALAGTFFIVTRPRTPKRMALVTPGNFVVACCPTW